MRASTAYTMYLSAFALFWTHAKQVISIVGAILFILVWVKLKFFSLVRFSSRTSGPLLTDTFNRFTSFIECARKRCVGYSCTFITFFRCIVGRNNMPNRPCKKHRSIKRCNCLNLRAWLWVKCFLEKLREREVGPFFQEGWLDSVLQAYRMNKQTNIIWAFAWRSLHSIASPFRICSCEWVLNVLCIQRQCVWLW